jgi:hypothetical protein
MNRRDFQLGMASVLIPAALVSTTACSVTAADDITIILAGVEGAADILLPLFSPAAVPVVDGILAAAQTATTEWGSTDATPIKLQKILTTFSDALVTVAHLSAVDQALIAGVIAAVNVVIKTVEALMTTPAKPALASRIAVASRLSGVAPNHAAVKSLLDAITKTRATLANRP